MANKTKLKLTTDLAGKHVIVTAVLSSWGLAIVYRVEDSLGLESEQQAYAQFPDGTAVPGWLGVDRIGRVRIGAQLSSPPNIPVDPAPHIADELAHGLSVAEISRGFVLSEATVKTHVARILIKTGSRDRAQAVALAYQSGLVVPRPRSGG